MVELEVIECRTWIFKEELDHLDTVCEEVNWHLFAFSNRNELLLVILNAVTCVKGKWFQMPLECGLVFQVDRTQTSALHIEELSCVKDCLFLLSSHSIEEVSIVWVLNQIDAAVCVLQVFHVSQHVLLLLL